MHPLLRRLLDDELLHGNEVAQTWRGFPEKRSICVMLRRPFTESTRAAAGVDYKFTNDMHYWYEELLHWPSGHYLLVQHPAGGGG